MPKGGRRHGAGRKPKAVETPERPPTDPSAVAEPGDLLPTERGVWRELASAACARGTLTPETAFGFRLLVETVVSYRSLRRRVLREGWLQNGAKHPLLSQYSQDRFRMEQMLARFGLTGDGRPVGKAAGRPVNPWADIAPKG